MPSTAPMVDAVIGITHHQDLIEVLRVPREVMARMGLRPYLAGRPAKGRVVH
jgi:hypothetical protein